MCGIVMSPACFQGQIGLWGQGAVDAWIIDEAVCVYIPFSVGWARALNMREN